MPSRSRTWNRQVGDLFPSDPQCDASPALTQWWATVTESESSVLFHGTQNTFTNTSLFWVSRNWLTLSPKADALFGTRVFDHFVYGAIRPQWDYKALSRTAGNRIRALSISPHGISIRAGVRASTDGNLNKASVPELGCTVLAVPAAVTLSTGSHTPPRIPACLLYPGSHTLILEHTLTANFHRGKQSCKLLCAFIWGEGFCLWRITPGGRWQLLSDDRGTSVPGSVSVPARSPGGASAPPVRADLCGGRRWNLAASRVPRVKCWGSWGYRWALTQQHSSVAGRAGACPRPKRNVPKYCDLMGAGEHHWLRARGQSLGMPHTPAKSWDKHYGRKGQDIREEEASRDCMAFSENVPFWSRYKGVDAFELWC